MSNEKESKEKLLTLSEIVIKLRNSSSRYIKIPDNEFSEIKHGDKATKIMKKEDSNFVYVVYCFEK